MKRFFNIDENTDLSNLSPEMDEMSEAYVFCDISGEFGSRLSAGFQPRRIEGMIVFLMLEGSPFDLTINQERYHITPNTIVLVFHGNVVCVDEPLPKDLKLYALFFGTNFLQDINMSISSIVVPPFFQRPQQVQLLNPDEASLLCKYIDLLRINTNNGPNAQLTHNIATSILSAMFYQMIQFYHRRVTRSFKTEEGATKIGRRHDYVRDFVRLVHQHCLKERSLAFYADKLFISPKYLSLLVKEATGRTATKWIDDFVLMEAKNMLKFSGKNIQQIAYSLNFPTQSSFGKYFKHLTGMSPTDYQKR